VVLAAAGASSHSTEPMSAPGARGKIRASTSAMRQLRSDPGAVDHFGDAIEREPVPCWVMIHEAPNSVTRAVTSGWVDRAVGLSLCASAAAGAPWLSVL
jgi:hypothetical protein